MTSEYGEYVSFSKENSSAQLIPQITTIQNNGILNHRKMTQEDFIRVDNKNFEPLPGCWIFRRRDLLSSTWQRRYASLRGSNIFLFQFSPNENPIEIIPLMNKCEIIATSSNSIQNNGYEWQVKYDDIPGFRIRSPTLADQQSWISTCLAQYQKMNDSSGPINVLIGQIAGKNTNNVTITPTMLINPDSKEKSARESMNADIIVPESEETEGTETDDEAEENDENDGSDMANEMKSNLEDEMDLENSYRDRLENEKSQTLSLQEEGRRREAIARKRAKSRQSITAARNAESSNPMTLAEMFRILLYFSNEELCEDPLPNIPVQIPYLKGEYAEKVVASTYKKYCNSTGYMSLEEFVDFMDDLAVVQTHAPHDDNDEPLREYQALLDPVRLVTTIPRNLGHSQNMLSTLSESFLRRKSIAAADIMTEEDIFIINFTQFYQLLLRITEIVYPELYEEDMTVAFNKFLQESMCPLYAWGRGHVKRGCVDPLLLDERIQLILLTYSPNLWKVFLMYALDHNRKIPDMNLPYPIFAQAAEKAVFGVPPGIPPPNPQLTTTAQPRSCGDTLMMSETAFLRLCQDYAISPHLLSTKQCRSIFDATSKPKLIQRGYSLIREKNTEMKAKKEGGPMSPMSPQSPPNSKESLTSPVSNTLGFSEFIEALARCAVDGMTQENYKVLFPTPYSQVLALLTMWGLADLKRLEEVRAIHTDEIS